MRRASLIAATAVAWALASCCGGRDPAVPAGSSPSASSFPSPSPDGAGAAAATAPAARRDGASGREEELRPRGRYVPPPEAGEVAANSRCPGCHGNFESEDLAASHLDADVGCERCHGSSDEHASDENNITAPDHLFAHDGVNAMCMTGKCHEREEVIEIDDDHVASVEGTAEQDGVCTACHGEHRMAQRTVHWDPATRKIREG